ncbi:MAG: A24 family peptidase [Pseudomonadota bacterium]|jgi:leader peptidase (prepilin peptidase)/N-methyltransferase
MIFESLQSSPPLFAASAAILGLMVGSFLNVVIHRLPKMMERDWQAQCTALKGEPSAAADAPYNLAVPPSACPSCGHRIGVLENIPLLSYLALKGRCSGCGVPIGLRYPLVETITGLLSGFTAWHFGFGLSALAALVLVWALIALTFIDLDTQLLPDSITQPLLWTGLLVNFGRTFSPLESAVIGAIAGYLALWSVFWLFKLATGKEGMGYGDFKLLAAIGAWLGWQMLPLTILLSSLVGAVTGIGLILFAGRGRHVPIPFGPYLAGGGLIALFWGQPITQTYLGGLYF